MTCSGILSHACFAFVTVAYIVFLLQIFFLCVIYTNESYAYVMEEIKFSAI